MAEHEVDIIHKFFSELITEHQKETAELKDEVLSLRQTTNELQAQFYDVQNQNGEYEVSFKCISAAASFRMMETTMSFVDGKPLPWKTDEDEKTPPPPKE